MNKNLVLVSGAIVFREKGKDVEWFLVKLSDDDGWEIPKVAVRKGESSVRAALRMMGEKAAMTTRVLEEVGRAGGVTNLNGKTLPQRHLYYLMLSKFDANEAIGFSEYAWLGHAQAMRKTSSKREKTMIKEAKLAYKKWKKERKARRKIQDEEETTE